MHNGYMLHNIICKAIITNSNTDFQYESLGMSLIQTAINKK